MSDIHFYTRGDGEHDILLVHGWASSSNMWNTIIEHFGHVGRFWALDLPGFGATKMPETPPTIEDHLGTLINFIEVNNIKPKVIIAHSMGGLITLKLAHQRPEITVNLVLICPVVTGNFGVQGLVGQLIRNDLGRFALRQTEQFWQHLQQDYLVKPTIDTWHSANKQLAKQIREDFLRVNPKAGIEALVSMAQQDMMPFLPDIQHPTLVNVGAQDVTVPPSEGRTAALYMPHAELHMYSKSRHHPQDEETEIFVPVLRQFLKHHGIS